MANDEWDYVTGELPRVSLDDTGGPPRPPRFRRSRLTVKLLAIVLVVWFFVIPLIPGMRAAYDRLSDVNPWLLLVGVAAMLASNCAVPLTCG